MTPLYLTLALAAAPAPVTGGDALDRQLDAALATARARASGEAAEPAPPATSASAHEAPAAEPLTLKPAERSTAGMGGALLMVGLAGAAWWAKRKRGARALGLRVVQHAGLGKGRDLVVVEHAGRSLLLGVTGASITVLRDDEAPTATTLHQPATSAAAYGGTPPRARGMAAFEEELSRTAEPPPGGGFDLARAALLEPRTEDEALRQKLGRLA